jgi:hypothetical protein
MSQSTRPQTLAPRSSHKRAPAPSAPRG